MLHFHLSRELSEDMLTINDVVLSTYLQIMLPYHFNPSIIAYELMVTAIDVIVKGRLLIVSLSHQ